VSAIACVDVDYRATAAVAACLVFGDWTSAAAREEVVASTALAGEYRPGAFYLRELPPLLAVLGRVGSPLAAIVVDGYAWLGMDHPGLGARLHEALGARVPIVGVAKTAYGGGGGGAPIPADHPHRAIAVTRGGSARPLFVTAAGMDVRDAAARVAAMHGAHRLPTLLKAVDRLARSAPT
jgi:deoxyribonuclease V